jgi:glycosyltransferase involved in cell wall biosynthesis
MTRIGVDGFNLALPHGTGVASYARELTWALRGLGASVDVLYGLEVPATTLREVRETLFFSELGRGPSATPAPRRGRWTRMRQAIPGPAPRTAVEVPVTGRVLADGMAARMPAFDRIFSYGGLFEVAARYFRCYGRFLPVRLSEPPAAMHWTYPLPLRVLGSRNIYTIHDVVPIRLPFTSLEDKRYHDRLLRACIADADAICTVSEASRRDILDLYGPAPDRVINTYQCVGASMASDELSREELAGRLRSLFALQDRGYFLHFGAVEPKKNLGRLIEAYLTLETETPLVVVSAPGWNSSAELRLLQDAHGLRLAGAARVRQFDYLPREFLMQLVRGARAVALPSLYEGFGLPALEAMALGTPVLTSNAGPLPEVCGEAALYVDPYDVSSIRRGLDCLDRDAALRERLSVAGAARAEVFSLKAYQARLSKLYDAALAPRQQERAVRRPACEMPQVSATAGRGLLRQRPAAGVQ